MPNPAVIIEHGPLPGLLGDVVALHGRYYARHWGFPASFEGQVAREMADFLARYDPTRDRIAWVRTEDRVLASITLDGSDPVLPPGMAHLRWFVADGATRGQGVGALLLRRAIDFARGAGFAKIYLTTFQGLHAASALYHAAGFRVVAEATGSSWGRTVLEQRLECNLRQQSS